MRLAAILAALALSSGSALAQAVPSSQPGPAMIADAPLRGPRADLARELPHLGFRDVDVRALSSGQVMQVYSLLYSNRSANSKRLLIRSALSGGGLLQRSVESILGRL